jgi:hypothetical protein
MSLFLNLISDVGVNVDIRQLLKASNVNVFVNMDVRLPRGAEFKNCVSVCGNLQQI